MVKNYTSQVPASRSVAHIENSLVKHGAKNIIKIYENKKITGVVFIIEVSEKDIPFRLPARIDKVEKQLRKTIIRPRSGTLDRIADQAERTAWKLLADWVDIQMSLIELDLVELIEIFMPYIYDHKKEQTFFEQIKNNGYKLLSDNNT